MKILLKIVKYLVCFLAIPLFYLLTALILTSITIEKKECTNTCKKSVYLSSNGVHLDIVLPKKHIDNNLLKDLIHQNIDNYLSFGWGDENFYINTPTWGDLTFKNTFSALFLKSSSLMHVTRFQNIQPNWIEIKVTDTQLEKLNNYILATFKKGKNGNKVILNNKGYTQKDDFYKALGSYSCFKTCNTWVNSGFKKSSLKSCYWTPFDFGLLKKHQ